MKVNDFDFNLPKSLIAQHPILKRDHSRLMILDRDNQTIEHHHFYDIIDYLDNNDCLVFNNTKVIPARLIGIKQFTDAVIEVLLLKETINGWEAMVKPAKRVKMGSIIFFGETLSAECVEIKDEGIRVFKMHYQGIFLEVLEKLGTLPLPPYIKEKLIDQDRYQTVYAKHPTSAAAPTAGLHFSNELLDQIKQKGIETVEVTLNVGLGTFKPMNVDLVTDHVMHEETYTITEESAKRLNDALKNNKRIVCVGTTSLRTLESNFNNQFHEGTYDTSIFIYPGYTFKVVDALITNFHLPKSTLIMLVSSFAGQDFIKKAYEVAIDSSYRFFSFGDAMFIK